jgi:A/G-specific adenine glycosylase
VPEPCVQPLPTFPPAARDALLAWYRAEGRPLAFRRTADPYAVLVSEAMAQQTQAARAAAYWERFMSQFPTVGDLAAASPADVLRAWQGLGYDRRGLALWRAAGVIVRDHGGVVPDTVEALDALPGVGPYTARAVAALAFGRPVGAVDVNVRRVLGRVVAGSPEALPPAEVQALADRTVPPDAPGEWTHAVMDLGATVCRARAPRCETCPIRTWCRYAATVQPSSTTAPRRAPSSTPTAFPSTRRWLRGRILDRLRAAPDGAWVALDVPIGTHEPAAVAVAARAMARDGVLELGPDPDGSLVARLPTG